METKVRHRRWPLAPLVGGGLASAAVLAAALFLRSTVDDASQVVAHGMGTMFSAGARGAIRQSGPPPWDEPLAQFLEEHAERGLRYVAIADADGTTWAQAGTRLAPSAPLGHFAFGNGVARIVERLPGPGAFAQGFGPGHRHRPRLTLEIQYEPVLALQLRSHARRVVGAAGLASGVILALALLLARSLAQQEGIRAELEQRRRLAALGEMSTVLAHELRNPLASIKGHAQLLAETVAGDQALRPRVERLVTDAARMERLMNDLLTFARTGELRVEPVDPDQLLREAVAATEPSRIDARYSGAEAIVSMDPARIVQALENLLRNALQASRPDARVEAAVELSEFQIQFRVSDRGPGIPRGEEERIFEPFVTTRVRGVGLGLAITRRIVELHGGRVQASNRDGGGAEFRISIPRRAA